MESLGVTTLVQNPLLIQPEAGGVMPTIALISYASEVMLKILQASLQQYVNREFPDVFQG